MGPRTFALSRRCPSGATRPSVSARVEVSFFRNRSFKLPIINPLINPSAGGEILTQRHNGHILLLSVLPESLSLSLTAPQTRLEARVQARLLDNRWHDIHLLYEQGTLQLVVDKQSVVVGKCRN